MKRREQNEEQTKVADADRIEQWKNTTRKPLINTRGTSKFKGHALVISKYINWNRIDYKILTFLMQIWAKPVINYMKIHVEDEAIVAFMNSNFAVDVTGNLPGKPRLIWRISNMATWFD